VDTGTTLGGMFGCISAFEDSLAGTCIYFAPLLFDLQDHYRIGEDINYPFTFVSDTIRIQYIPLTSIQHVLHTYSVSSIISSSDECTLTAYVLLYKSH
jgi:hypothetical protein